MLFGKFVQELIIGGACADIFFFKHSPVWLIF